MFLAIDIGNTDVVFGVYRDRNWAQTFRISSRIGADAAPYQEFWRHILSQNDWKPTDFERVMLSTVVPSLKPVFTAWLHTDFGEEKVLVMGPELYSSLPVRVQNEKEIGTDLVANAVAGWCRFREATVVVDFGTALTFTVVAQTGEVAGVAIAPGLKTSMRALFSNAAQLYEAPLKLPESVLGRSTEHALQAGILHGYIGLVGYLLDKIEDEMNRPCRVVATGGLVSILTPLHERFDAIDPYLTLEGLRLISLFHKTGM